MSPIHISVLSLSMLGRGSEGEVVVFPSSRQRRAGQVFVIVSNAEFLTRSYDSMDN